MDQNVTNYGAPIVLLIFVYIVEQIERTPLISSQSLW
jgi:hypothetical protein